MIPAAARPRAGAGGAAAPAAGAEESGGARGGTGRALRCPGDGGGAARRGWARPGPPAMGCRGAVRGIRPERASGSAGCGETKSG